MVDDGAYVAVVGDRGGVGEQTLADAEAVGRLLGERGAVLLCGGRGGVMEAACRGARGAGGVTVGLLPGGDRREANRHVSIALATGMGELRNGLVVRAADTVIAVGGRYGTLSEIALALVADIPVVGLGTWELARGGAPDEAIVEASDPEDAVRRALALAAGGAR